LGQYYLRELQLVRRTQAIVIGARFVFALSAAAAIFRNDADFQHTVTERSCAALMVPINKAALSIVASWLWCQTTIALN
jgi:hypothetical protein